MTPVPAPIIAPKTRNKSLAMMPSYLRSTNDQIDPAKKPIAAQTTRAPFVQRNDLSMAIPGRLSWGLHRQLHRFLTKIISDFLFKFADRRVVPALSTPLVPFGSADWPRFEPPRALTASATRLKLLPA
jgi:hypothetical protein